MTVGYGRQEYMDTVLEIGTDPFGMELKWKKLTEFRIYYNMDLFQRANLYYISAITNCV